MDELRAASWDDDAEAVSFVGRGFAWPLRVDHAGAIALTRGAEELDESIRLVLVTAPGERVMRPRFGCRIWELLFEPITPNLLGQIAHAVGEALGEWEPRVVVEDVRPVPDTAVEGGVRIEIDYRVRATNSRRNLVFPFYLIPHHAD